MRVYKGGKLRERERKESETERVKGGKEKGAKVAEKIR